MLSEIDFLKEVKTIILEDKEYSEGIVYKMLKDRILLLEKEVS